MCSHTSNCYSPELICICFDRAKGKGTCTRIARLYNFEDMYEEYPNPRYNYYCPMPMWWW